MEQHAARTVTIDAQHTQALQDLCAMQQVTLHSLIQFVWHKVLHAFGGGESTVIGTIASGRNLPIDSIEQSVGLFINTLPSIVNHKQQSTQSILQALLSIQATVNTMNSKVTYQITI